MTVAFGILAAAATIAFLWLAFLVAIRLVEGHWWPGWPLAMFYDATFGWKRPRTWGPE